MIALALSLALLAPDGGLADQIAQCGIARDQISTRFEDMLQDETATIATPAAALTGDQLSCLAGLAVTGRVFAFADPAAQKRLDPLIEASERAEATAEARQWLTDHGLLDKLPVYDPKHQTLAAFGASLEALCSLPVGIAIRGDGRMLNIIAPADFSEGALTTFQCITSAALVADSPQGLYTIRLVERIKAEPIQ